jgi:integrase
VGDVDESRLWWRPATDDTVTLTARRIELFSEWLSSIGEDRAINPKDRAATFCERLTQARAFAKKRSASSLAHTMSAARASEGFGTARAVSAPVRKQDRIDDLLWKGFEINRFKQDRRAWRRLNLRDILITLLCLYGGVRQSEAMHLWVDDVFEHPDDPASCIVLIHAPESGVCEYTDPLTKAKARTTRIDYLHRYCGQKLPLTMETGRRKAGWKGGLLTKRDRNAIQVFWIDPVAGKLFRRLWQLYIACIRPTLPQTPWAFLTKHGQPMGTAAYAASFKAAVAKIGMPPGKWSGATPHGLRHRYGQWLNDLEISEKAGQLCLHHSSIKSQQVYRQPSIEKVADEIKKASEAARLPIFQTLDWSGHDK